MRRARISVKPSLNPRGARPTERVGSKEETSEDDGSQKKSTEEGTSGSVPAAAETNSSPSSAPKLNLRRPAFSVRPKPTLRGLGVPNLHGSEPTPIVLQPVSESKETDGSGDAVKSDVKETPKTEEPVVSVPVPLDIKEKPAAAQESTKESKSEDADKILPKEKETNSLFQRRSRFQVTPKIQSNPPIPPSTTDPQPPEKDVEENVPEKVSDEVHANKSGPPSDETNDNSKSNPVIPKPDVETAKSPAAKIPACQEVDISVPLALVDNGATSSNTPKETADKEKPLEPKTETISKQSLNTPESKPIPIRRSRFAVQPKLGAKTPSRKPPTISEPENNGQNVDNTKTVKESEVNAEDSTSKETVSPDSNKNESQSDPVSIPRRSKFQPKLNFRGKVPLSSRLTSVDTLSESQSDVGVTNTQTDDSLSNKDQSDAPVCRVETPKVEEDIETSIKPVSKSESAVLPRRNRFQIQPKPSLKTTEQSASPSTSENVSASQSVTTDDSTSICISAEIDSAKEKKDSEDKVADKDGGSSSNEMASKVETTVLPRRSRFQVQPKPSAKVTSSQSSSPASSKQNAVKLTANQSVAPKSTSSVSTEDIVTLEDDDNKQKDDVADEDDTDNVTASNGTEGNSGNTILPRRSRFLAKPKLGARDQSPAISKPSKVTPTATISEVDTKEQKNDSEKKDGNQDTVAVSKETVSETKEVPSVSRRMRFAVRPKLGVSQPKDEQPSTPVEEKTSDETSKAPNENAPVVETAVLPRRNRFQIQPKASPKTPKQTSTDSSKVISVKTSSSPPLSENVTTLKGSEEKTASEVDGKSNDGETATTELPLKREQVPLPTLTRRSRFQVQPRMGTSQSKDNQKAPSENEKVNEESAKTSNENSVKSEAKILPRRGRFQIQPKARAKTSIEQSSPIADSKQSVSNNDIPSICDESVTSDNGAAQTNDSENKDATSKTDKTAGPTLSRRSRFNVRPKLGISKEPVKSPGIAKEKGVEKTPPKSTTPTVQSPAKDAKKRKVDKQSTLPLTDTTQDDLLDSESPRALEDSWNDSSVPITPVKSTNRNSISSPLKDNIQIENIKQREYPVNVHKFSGKRGKKLPLSEKQKKPDISVHPSDKPPDRGKMRMRDLIYWNPSSSPMKSPEAKRPRPIRQEDPAPKEPEPTPDENEPMAVPQVKIGADGCIVLNEESLVINNSQPTAPISMEVVDETDVYSNYGSFRKYSPKSKWSLKETKRFFLALSTVGTDFSLMTNLFKKKNRRDLKNKFKREERNNRWLVDKAIQQQLHFDEKLFESMSESEEEEPPPKKTRQKKDPSEKKKKEPKPRKNKKTTDPDSTPTPPKKRTRKSKKITSKDFIIESQDDESKESEGTVVEEELVEEEMIVHDGAEVEVVDEEEEIVEEEPAQDEMLIIPENTSYYDDSLTSDSPDADNRTESTPTNEQEAVVTPEGQTQEDEVVGILMEMGQRGFTLPPNSRVPSSTSKRPRKKAPAPTMPMINTPSARTAVASKELEVVDRVKSSPKSPKGVSKPGSSSGGSHATAADGAVTPATQEARDSNNLARLFLQQMGLSSQMNALQDEIVSITEAEISHNDEKQKVILVEVQPKDQKQTVVHMYLVSRVEGAQSSADGSSGQVTVSEAQPLTLPSSMSSLSTAQSSDLKIASVTESNTNPEQDSAPAPAPVPASEASTSASS